MYPFDSQQSLKLREQLFSQNHLYVKDYLLSEKSLQLNQNVQLNHQKGSGDALLSLISSNQIVSKHINAVLERLAVESLRIDQQEGLHKELIEQWLKQLVKLVKLLERSSSSDQRQNKGELEKELINVQARVEALFSKLKKDDAISRGYYAKVNKTTQKWSEPPHISKYLEKNQPIPSSYWLQDGDVVTVLERLRKIVSGFGQNDNSKGTDAVGARQDLLRSGHQQANSSDALSRRLQEAVYIHHTPVSGDPQIGPQDHAYLHQEIASRLKAGVKKAFVLFENRGHWQLRIYSLNHGNIESNLYNPPGDGCCGDHALAYLTRAVKAELESAVLDAELLEKRQVEVLGSKAFSVTSALKEDRGVQSQQNHEHGTNNPLDKRNALQQLEDDFKGFGSYLNKQASGQTYREQTVTLIRQTITEVEKTVAEDKSSWARQPIVEIAQTTSKKGKNPVSAWQSEYNLKEIIERNQKVSQLVDDLARQKLSDDERKEQWTKSVSSFFEPIKSKQKDISGKGEEKNSQKSFHLALK